METSGASLWEQTLAALRSVIDHESFATWLFPTVQHSFKDSVLVVAVQDAASRAQLSTRFIEVILAEVEKIAGRPIDVQFRVGQSFDTTPELLPKPAGEIYRSSRVKGEYTFENFVVGDSNRFAFTSSEMVAEAGDRGYNPMFIYGGVGLGKTHLMHAIGNRVLRNNPDLSVLYISGEQFMNAFVESIRSRTQPEFRNYYRNIDLLLMDDVQFIIGREQTQIEFFHTFNALYDLGHKIVIASDRPPSELNSIDERLRNRFEWGLTADIQPPDLTTRTRIVEAKAKAQELDLPFTFAKRIAECITTNVRGLESAVTKLKVISRINKRPVNSEQVNQVLAPLMTTEQIGRVTPEVVCRAVADCLNMDVADIKGNSRVSKHVLPRHIAMYLCRELIKMSFPEIGLFFQRDHTTIMSACKKLAERLNTDSSLQNMIMLLSRQLLQHPK